MKNKILRIPALLLGITLLVSACGQSAQAPVNSEAAVSEAEQESTADYRDASLDIEIRVEALLSQMTLDEKIGQMIQAEQAAITPEEVTEYGVGSVLSGGGSSPSTGNKPVNWQERVNDLKTAATKTRLGIPLVYGIDAVHGNNNLYGAVVYPHNSGLGAANDAELMTEIGEAVASEVRAIGVQWDFAPCLANPQDVTWGRTYEGFSENTDDIVPLASAFIDGLQGDLQDGAYMDDSHVIACAKHFIGEGYTKDGENQGDVKMTDEEFDELLNAGVLDPYSAAVNENVLTVMASYNSVNGVKCHENHHLLTEVLKEQLGFQGYVIGDYNAVKQVSGSTYKQQVANAINAGVDMIMEPNDWKEWITAIKDAVNEGLISQERIDDAVTRILRVKFTAGLFEEEIGGATETALQEEFGSEAHREIARRAVRESLVCLKNDMVGETTAMEALQNATGITMCGSAAYDLGNQCGGWTITWQGQSGNKISEGTTIIQGVYEQVQDHASVSQTVDGSITEGSDAVIVVFGEVPYAESEGDRTDEMPEIATRDKVMLDKIKENIASLPEAVPVIGLVIAGRPINIDEYADMFDGIVMGWLPGTEGQGIADVLFGEYDFSGTLSFTWRGGDGVEEKFPYGYGLKKDGTKLTRNE